MSEYTTAKEYFKKALKFDEQTSNGIASDHSYCSCFV